MAEKKTDLSLPDTPLNPFRVKPPEGQMMSVMRSSQDGELDRIVSSVTGWHFRCEEDDFDPNAVDEWEKWELIRDFDGNGTRVFTPKQKGMPEAEFGIIWVGFLRALYLPHLRYAKWEKKPTETEATLVGKDRSDSPFFFFQYNMGISVAEVESVGNIRTTIRVNVMVRILNPYKAIFQAGGWESLLDASVHGAARECLGPMTVDEIRQQKEADQDKKSLAGRILELNNSGLHEKFGIEIIDVRFVGFDIVENPSVMKALEAKEVNRLLAEAAEQKAKEIRTIAEAQADAARLSVASYGSGAAAAQVRSAELLSEALTNTNAQVVSLGGNSVPIAVTP